MLDRFDRALLDEIQRDDSQTADQLAQAVALSSSAIARRLRRLRSGGFIARTIALLSPKLTKDRLRAIVLIQLNEHADLERKAAGLLSAGAQPARNLEAPVRCARGPGAVSHRRFGVASA